MREVFLDIGELGWSFYLSAHMRWLKFMNKPIPAVIVLEGRELLYKNLTDKIWTVTSDSIPFNVGSQSRFTFHNVSGEMLRKHYSQHLVEGYYISKTQPFDCHNWYKVYVGQMLFRPYATEFIWHGIKRDEIHVFPRYRKSKHFSPRNLPKAFYAELLYRLCSEFKDCMIKTIGTRSGAYDIDIDKENYMNLLDHTSIEDLISGAPLVRCAIGSQSAPLKLMLLQSVPTFMIGHEKKRHTETENWMGTRAGFYEIAKNRYNDFDQYPIENKICIDKIVEFIKDGCL